MLQLTQQESIDQALHWNFPNTRLGHWCKSKPFMTQIYLLHLHPGLILSCHTNIQGSIYLYPLKKKSKHQTGIHMEKRALDHEAGRNKQPRRLSSKKHQWYQLNKNNQLKGMELPRHSHAWAVCCNHRIINQKISKKIFLTCLFLCFKKKLKNWIFFSLN